MTNTAGGRTQRNLDARLPRDDHLLDIAAGRLDDGRLAPDHRVIAGDNGYGRNTVAPAVLEVFLAGIDGVDDGQKRYVIVALVGLVHAARTVGLDKAGQNHFAGSIDHAVVAWDRQILADRLDLAVTDEDNAAIDRRARNRQNAAPPDGPFFLTRPPPLPPRPPPPPP